MTPIKRSIILDVGDGLVVLGASGTRINSFGGELGTDCFLLVFFFVAGGGNFSPAAESSVTATFLFDTRLERRFDGVVGVVGALVFERAIVCKAKKGKQTKCLLCVCCGGGERKVHDAWR